MNILAFDCSTLGCSAAVVADGSVRACQSLNAGRTQAEALVPLLAAVAGAAGIAWTEIGLVAVTVGPGRFTGLRIGLAAARALALALGIPVAGVTTHEAVAAAISQAERAGRRLVVAIDGGRADLFVQEFGDGAAAAGPIEALMPEAAAGRLADGKGEILLAGDGASRLLPFLPRARLSAAPVFPDPVALARAAAARFAEGAALAPTPLYVHPPDTTAAERGA